MLMPNYRKPEAAKRRSGTYRPGRATRTAKAVAVLSVPPARPHLTDLAKAEYRWLAPLMYAQNTMAAPDLRGFEMLCETLATATMAQAAIAAEGLTVITPTGARAHPAIKILEAARAGATRLLIEYGLTPRAREHVSAAPDEAPGNAFADLK
jgi:P27 family predicted phage terminase small subunit